jgi:hypothetical protein
VYLTDAEYQDWVAKHKKPAANTQQQ